MNGLNLVYSPLLSTGCLIRVREGSLTAQTSVCGAPPIARAPPIDLTLPTAGVPPIALALIALALGALEKKG